MAKAIVHASGADVNAKNKDGWTPLHLAGYNGQMETIRILLDAKANPSLRTKDRKIAYDLAEEQKKEEAAALLDKVTPRLPSGDAALADIVRNSYMPPHFLEVEGFKPVVKAFSGFFAEGKWRATHVEKRRATVQFSGRYSMSGGDPVAPAVFGKESVRKMFRMDFYLDMDEDGRPVWSPAGGRVNANALEDEGLWNFLYTVFLQTHD